MDPAAHSRFLHYLELFEYFGQPGQARLHVDEWRQLDAELVALLAAPGRPDADGARRIATLRRALLRD